MLRRGRAARRALPAVVLVAVLAGCIPKPPPPPPLVPPAPTFFTSIGAPAGALTFGGGANEWYWAPAPAGHAVTLGVYRPTGPGPTTTTTTTLPPVTTTQPPVTTTTAPEVTTTTAPEVTTTTAPEPVTTTTTPEVTTTTGPESQAQSPPASAAAAMPPALLILNGGDGFRRLYEGLAQRFAAQGFTVIVGCWFDHPTPYNKRTDGIACVRGPTWKGMNAGSVADLNALVAAAGLVPNVDPSRLAILGHSYGAGVALLRAAAGHNEPVISSSGFIARYPTYNGGLPNDQYAAEVGSSIHAPVLVMHGRADPITPLGQAEALVASLPADNPATTDYFVAPASHAFPWQAEELSDRPGAPMSQRYIESVTAWLYAQFA